MQKMFVKKQEISAFF